MGEINILDEFIQLLANIQTAERIMVNVYGRWIQLDKQDCWNQIKSLTTNEINSPTMKCPAWQWKRNDLYIFC